MAVFTIKPGVEPRSLWILAALSRTKAPVEVTVTSGTDGKHMKGSKHYSGNAVDLRSKNFPTHESKLAFISRLRAELGKGYDILLEGVGTPNEHFHIEWDPK